MATAPRVIPFNLEGQNEPMPIVRHVAERPRLGLAFARHCRRIRFRLASRRSPAPAVAGDRPQANRHQQIAKCTSEPSLRTLKDRAHLHQCPCANACCRDAARCQCPRNAAKRLHSARMNFTSCPFRVSADLPMPFPEVISGKTELFACS